jgi:ABC-type oligopeptide transport system substrate-binding subunit
MKRSRVLGGAALALVGAILAGCSTAEDASGEADTAPLVVATQKPTSLIPGNSRGFFALMVAETLFSGLMKYDRETGEPELLVAASVESDDQKVWNIELNDGWTFHNGEAVDAASFARAWNATANPANAWLGSPNMANIVGYDEIAPAEGEPTATELSGIVVNDDLSLTVTLAEANSQFPYLLGQPAFYPMPQAGLDDLEAYATLPIGNGPYELTEAWTGGEEILTARFDDYGGDVALNSGVTFRVYTGYDVAYRDYQAGEVDISQLLNTDVAAASASYDDLFFSAPAAAYMSYLSTPTYAAGYDDPRIRHALSMAIDREQIIETLFQDDSYLPATDFGVPASVGYRDDACGEYCEFDPDAAKALWDEAGGLPELTLSVVTGTGRDAYSEAIINMWEENLGATVTMNFLPSENTHAALLGQETQNPVSLGRASDYPSPYSILGSSFLTGAPSNYSFYNSAEYDALIAAALAAGTTDEGTALFDEAKDVLIEDMPMIPLWTTGTNYVASERVADSFEIDPYNKSPFSTIAVN